MTLSKKERFRLSEQAALRLIRAQEHESDEDRADFVAWTRLSAHHVHEMMFAQAVSKQMEGMDPTRAIDVDTLPDLPELTISIADDEPLMPHAQQSGRASQRRKNWRFALAASLVAAACLAWLFEERWDQERQFATAVGEQRSIKLEDGSVMVLNTGSRAEIKYSRDARAIELLEGEALFVVQRDSVRPFQVSTESGSVVALGTQFNVYRYGAAMRVSVLEGAVQVSAGSAETGRLDAGDEAVVGDGKVIKTTKPDIQRSVAWRTRQLVFRDATLAAVADEFNRYNKVSIRVEGDTVRSRSVSGVFEADDAQPLIEFLEGDPRLRVARGETEIVIRERN